MEQPEYKRTPAQTVICMRHTGSHDDIGAVYRALYQWARERNVTITGKGCTLFVGSRPDKSPMPSEYEVCLPVAHPPVSEGEVLVKELPACTVAAVRVKGPYSQIPARYTGLLAWLSAEGRDVAGPPREVYVRRPSAEGKGDPEAFVTEIQVPVRPTSEEE